MHTLTRLLVSLAVSATLFLSLPASAGPVDINTADAETLSTLKGIGPKTAMRIITYREETGNFKAVEDLMEVKGIGEKSFEALKPFITVK